MDEHPQQTELLTGSFGRYAIVKPLGAGGMGEVYLAHDSQLDRPVALKVPKADRTTAELLERFDREARAAATVSHPNICAIYDVGEIEGRRYISMAFVDGRPLSQFISPERPQKPRHIASVLRKLSRGLHEAHQAGVVHRDLKPANILIDARGEPIVTDFGLALRQSTEEEIRVTGSGMIIGTPAYMSPEQIMGKAQEIGPASDIFSLGVILYELLTGRLPFTGPPTTVIGKILTEEPTPPREHNSTVDEGLESICLKMMAKRPEDRYPSMAAVADAVSAWHRDRKQSASDDTLSANSGLNLTSEERPSTETDTLIRPSSETPPPLPPTAWSVANAAQELLDRHEYGAAMAVLTQIPDELRSPEDEELLSRATELQFEVSLLNSEIEHAVSGAPSPAKLERLNRLLELKPDHPRAKLLKTELLSKSQSIRGNKKKSAAATARHTPPPLRKQRKKSKKTAKAQSQRQFVVWASAIAGTLLVIFIADWMTRRGHAPAKPRDRQPQSTVPPIVGKKTQPNIQPAPADDESEQPDLPKESEWVSLFNGSDLVGWTVIGGSSQSWDVKDGTIVVTGADTGNWLSTSRQYEDFELEFEYNLSSGANSGVFLRTPWAGQLADRQRLEVQLLHDGHPKNRNLAADRTNGAVHGVLSVSRFERTPPFKWNTMLIAMRGDEITVRVNGSEVSRGNLNDLRDRMDSRGIQYGKRGYIGFQNYGDHVEFRNIRIRELAPNANPAAPPPVKKKRSWFGD